MIRKLDWDSAFFNLAVGEWHAGEEASGARVFDVIYAKGSKTDDYSPEGFAKTFSETKVVFSKQLTTGKHLEERPIREVNEKQVIASLYELAFESGKHSRFLLDSRFGKDNFEKLYKTWVDNSLNGQFATKVLVYDEGLKLSGLVTYKINEGFATVGLIAVSPDRQGHGIGRELLAHVEKELAENNIFELRIPTQLENEAACRFYKKQGYKIIETTQITHYWKNDTV